VREFKPSLTRPLRAVQCRAPVKNGDEVGRRCKKKALLGGLVCRSHGGQLPSVQAAAAHAVEEASLRLLQATEDALAVLELLMDQAQSEAVRLRARWRFWIEPASGEGSRSAPCPQVESPLAILDRRLGELGRRMTEADEAGLIGLTQHV
jgi:hypothetical protein